MFLRLKIQSQPIFLLSWSFTQSLLSLHKPSRDPTSVTCSSVLERDQFFSRKTFLGDSSFPNPPPPPSLTLLPQVPGHFPFLGSLTRVVWVGPILVLCPPPSSGGRFLDLVSLPLPLPSRLSSFCRRFLSKFTVFVFSVESHPYTCCSPDSYVLRSLHRRPRDPLLFSLQRSHILFRLMFRLPHNTPSGSPGPREVFPFVPRLGLPPST